MLKTYEHAKYCKTLRLNPIFRRFGYLISDDNNHIEYFKCPECGLEIGEDVITSVLEGRASSDVVRPYFKHEHMDGSHVIFIELKGTLVIEI